MALWNALGQAATIAQLAGMDAAGLISAIVQAVQTVQRNKVECQQLVNHVMMINDLLQLLQESETMRRREIRRPLDGLEDTLRQAYMLVTSCQKSNIMCRFVMAGNQAEKFRNIRDRIDSYLHIYPLISHIDTRYFITELYSRGHPSDTQPQVSEDVLGSFTTHLNPDSWSEGSTSTGNGVVSVEVQGGSQPPAVDMQQNNGYGNAEVFSNKTHRFRWLFQWTQKEASTTQSIHRLIRHLGTGHFTVFKFSQLAASTNNFSSLNIIGRGSFGTVFKGILPNGVDVAIKMNSTTSRYGPSAFLAEVLTLPKLQHANIVKLLGCCFEGGNMILVYEYICNGCLCDKIRELRAGVSLSWHTRFQVIEGIVQGALYLNHHSRPRVIHGDLKTSNIVLDSDMTPRIIDFGIAEILSSDEDEKDVGVKGTMQDHSITLFHRETNLLFIKNGCAFGPFFRGYMDPEYALRGVISIKSDAYAFGVILLEIIKGQHFNDNFCTPATSFSVYNAWELWSSGRAMELVDPGLHDEPQISNILRCIQIALLCIQEKREYRPTMSDILLMLKCESMTLPVLRPPLRWYFHRQMPVIH